MQASPPRPPTPTNGRRVLALLALTLVLAALMILLPPAGSTLLMGAVLLLALGVALQRAELNTPSRLSAALTHRLTLPRALLRYHFPAGIRRSDALSLAGSVGFAGGLLLAALLWPVSPLLTGIVVLLVIGMGAVGVMSLGWRPLLFLRGLLHGLRALLAPDSRVVPALPRRQALTELALVSALGLLAAQLYVQAPAGTTYSGLEAEWLTSSIYTASVELRQTGRLPLWQPYLEGGEPLLENPFAFIFNPFLSVPSFVAGPEIGVRVSAALTAVIAAAGGWFLGRALGLSIVGRLLLAGLLLGKGSMHAMLSTGYFQLAVSQAYMPWVIGGVLTVLRWPRDRWPVVLTALALALLFLSGNLWYVLPTALGALLVGAAGILRPWDRLGARRLALAALLALGLSAVSLIPVALHFERIGDHPRETEAGWVVPLWRDIVPAYFDGDYFRTVEIFKPYWQQTEYNFLHEVDEFYYIFTVPAAYVLLLLFIPLYRWGGTRRFGLITLASLALATLWGAGGSPLFRWLYDTLPWVAQWRFVGRALAVGGFWLAVLVALRADGLWRGLTQTDWRTLGLRSRALRAVPLLAALAVVGGGALAVQQTNQSWRGAANILRPLDFEYERCTAWLRGTHPDEQLTTFLGGYHVIWPLLRQNIRTWDVQADFQMLPDPSTIGHPDMNLFALLPEFGIATTRGERLFLLENGFRRLTSSPPLKDQPCLWQREDALPYAFTLPAVVFESVRLVTDREPRNQPILPLNLVRPAAFERRPGLVAVRVEEPRLVETVLTAAERAYPGWQVTVNGEPAVLESVGRQIGVRLPTGREAVWVLFEYRPPLLALGGAVSLLTGIGAILLLVGGGLRALLRPRLWAFIALGGLTLTGLLLLQSAAPESGPTVFVLLMIACLILAAWRSPRSLDRSVRKTSQWMQTLFAQGGLIARGMALLALVACGLAAWTFRGAVISGARPMEAALLLLGATTAAALGLSRWSAWWGTPAQPAPSALVTSATGWRWVLVGALLLWVCAEISGNMLRLNLFTGTAYPVQVLLLLSGFAAVGVGLGGRPRGMRLARREALLLGGVLLLALALRVVNLENMIHRFVDEIHSANAIVRLWVRPDMPILTPFGDVTAFPWLYPLAQSAFVSLIGPGLTALRLPSALFGTLTVLALYALARVLFGRRIALAAAVILATLPAHVHFSRLGINNIADPLFGVLGLALLARALRDGRQSDWAWGGVCFGLTQYFYEGGRLLYPPLALIWLGLVALVGVMGTSAAAPRRSAWFGRVLRGGLRAGAAALLVAAPVYYAYAGAGVLLAPRLQSEARDEMPLTADQQLDRLTFPWLMFVAATDQSWFMGGSQPLVPLPLVPLLLLGAALTMACIRQPWALLLACWLALTAFGNMLLRDVIWAPRYVVALPALALLLAVGLRLGLRALWPSQRGGRWRGWTVGAALAALALTQTVTFFQLQTQWYTLMRISSDWEDALFRTAGLPRDTEIVLLLPASIWDYNISTMQAFFDLPPRISHYYPSELTDEGAAELARLGASREFVFFIHPTDRDTLATLRRHFYLLPPEFSPYNVPPEFQLGLYRAPRFTRIPSAPPP